MKDLLMRISVGVVFIAIFTIGIVFVLSESHKTISTTQPLRSTDTTSSTSPLSIEYMRSQKYPGSDITIEEELSSGTNYKQYIVSFLSGGLKEYALLTVPTTEQPEGGYPAIIFNHGYIPPEEYRTTEKYIAYVDGFARSGYVVMKPDYRGHGSSEGKPEGAYFSPGYTIDVLNALSSVEKLPYVNKNKIGMWGHSMGGNITQRILVTVPDIKAAVIWGGVVGSYENLFQDWWSKRTSTFTPSNRELTTNRPSRQTFIARYGNPTGDSVFWNAISPTSFLKYQTAPVQLHQGLSDETVPFKLSQDYYDKLKKENKPVEIYFYEGNDHNLSQSFNLAMQRSIKFFDKYLK